MKRKPLALLLAAALLAGTFSSAMAEDEAPPPEQQEYSSQEWGRGPGRHHRGPRDDRRDGPGRRGDGPGWRGDGPGCRGDGPGFEFGRKRGFHHGDFGIGFGGARAFDKLNLDDAQKAKLVDVLTNSFRARLEARMTLNDAQNKLRDLRDDDSASADAIVAANVALGEAKGKLDVLGRKFREDIKGVLTEEQVKQLEEMRNAPPPPPPGKWDRKDRDERGPGGPGERRPPHMERGPGPRR